MNQRPSRNERGAVAVIFAISALLFFGVAAMGVDLGNAMNRKKQTQTSSDLAALAGASGLPDTSDATVQLVADYLNKNQPRTDANDKCDTSDGDITVEQLTDDDKSNGEVTFPSSSKITVWSPASKVQFGLAAAIGFNDTCVQSVATAAIKSGAPGFAPYYATEACSSEPQVLKSDAGGPSIPFSVPPLKYDSDVNTSVLTDATNNPFPNQIPLATSGAPDGPVITLSGTNLGPATIDKVGFFRSDGSEPQPATPVLNPPQSATSVSVTVPNAVASVQDVWWIRVHDSVTNTWSKREEARPFLVGDAVLSCDPEAASGNFGSIDIPWTNGNPNTNLAIAIEKGLPPPMSLKEFPGPAPYPAQNECQNDPDGVISTWSLLMPETNCVQSTAGLRAEPAYDGYIASGGKLDVDTSDLCRSQGQPQRLLLSTGEKINDDTLTCYLKNDTLHLSDAIHFTGTESPFVPDLWKSPRFVLVPVIEVDPTGTKWMPIIKFVPGFICDQTSGATRASPTESGQTEDGFVMQNPHKLRAIRIVFFDYAAVPPPPDGTDLIDYIGSGPKVITLID